MKVYSHILLFTVLFLLAASSCTSYKNVPYLQVDEIESHFQTRNEDAVLRFKQEDILGITVNVSGESSVAADFNLPFHPLATGENSKESSVPQGYGRQTYQVNPSGEIDFPVLGVIRVEGLSMEELESYLKRELKRYLKTDPIINIRLLNFRISVLGEVSRPGEYSVSRNQATVLEALALAGDMSIYGRRDNVRLARKLPDGELKIVILDITDPQITQSPYFYLQQNDVLYVEPNKARARSADIGSQTSILISLASVLLTAVNLIVLIVK